MEPLHELGQAEQKRFSQIRFKHEDLFEGHVPLHPIPFFGDICNAKVLTLALNPAWTEFKGRSWPEGLNASALVERLIGYFDLPETEPHRWFEECSRSLSYLGCSYCCNSAHVDLFPYPTKFQNKLTQKQRLALAELIVGSANRLGQVLRVCRAVKLVLVIDYPFPVPGISHPTSTFNFIKHRMPVLARHIRENGKFPPIFRAGTIDKLSQHILRNRSLLWNHLHLADCVNFSE